jgi:uncharacterized protein (DUF169 family)
MDWKRESEEIRQVLGLTGNPVAITYSTDPYPGAVKGRHRVCDALILARDGAIVDISAKTSACMGGTHSLGLCDMAPGGDRVLKDFLVNGEKLYSSVAALYRQQALATPAPVNMAEHVVMGPLGGVDLTPDLILFICNPVQACRLVTLDSFDTGIPPKIEMAGATCHQAVGYPVAAGELNVTLMDYTSRRIKAYGPNDLIVTIPLHRFPGVMRSIDRCTAGRAPFVVPEAFRKRMGRGTLEDLE